VLEAKKLGFHQVILPSVCMPSVKQITGIQLIPVSTVADAANAIM
jgi:predicted ATP-dependent serine protease